MFSLQNEIVEHGKTYIDSHFSNILSVMLY